MSDLAEKSVLHQLSNERQDMNQQKQDLYVLFELSCGCGAKLQVHGEHYVGIRVGGFIVTCPKCGKDHDLPTKPLRFYLLEGTTWNLMPLP